MARRRWSTLVVAVVVAGLGVLAPATTSTAAPGDAHLTIVHGLGPEPNPVDVYVDGDLLAADVDYAEQIQADLPGGTYTFEVCAASPAPPDPLPDTGCETSANFPNGGVDVTVVGGTTYAAVAQFAGTGPAAGRPTIVAYPIDVSCLGEFVRPVPGIGRVSFVHAAAAPVVDVVFEGPFLSPNPLTPFSDVAPETSGSVLMVPVPTSFDLTVQQVDATVLVEEAIDATLAMNNNVFVFVGNPQQEAGYDVLQIRYPIDWCAPATTTTTPTPPSTAPPAVTPVQVTPTFTG